MLCPSCSGPMSRGTASLGQQLFDAFLSGASASQLVLETPDRSERTVMSSGERRQAWECRNCQLTVLTPTESHAEYLTVGNAAEAKQSTEGLKCLRCDASMTPDGITCTECGWTWQE